MPGGAFLIECDTEKDQLVTMVVESASRTLRRRGVFPFLQMCDTTGDM